MIVEETIDGVTRLFAGTVDYTDTTKVVSPNPWKIIDVSCVDYNQIFDRFFIAESFVNPLQNLREIVTFIVDGYLSEEGINVDNVDTGPLIPETKVFNFKTITQVFNELATLTNYVYYLDYHKNLFFKPRGAISNTDQLTEANILSYKVRRGRSIGPYRNRQYVRAGTAETEERTENLHGDSFRKTFNTSYEIAKEPTVTLNGGAATIGVLGLETGTKQFYWSKGSNQIVQDDAGSLLSSIDVLAVTYVGRYPLLVVAQLDEEIEARKVVEGGSGVYEALKTDPNLNDLDATESLANALLLVNGFIPDEIVVTTRSRGFRAGQLITVYLPDEGIDDNYLIQKVDISDVSGDPSVLQYTISLTNSLASLA